MRFHYDPNRTRLQKQPKLDSPKKQSPKQELPTEPIEEKVIPQQEIPQFVESKKKVSIPDEVPNENLFQPKEDWIQPPEYQTVSTELEEPKCPENQIYLALYEQCFNDEVKKFKEFFAQYPDLLYYCDKMADKTNQFLKKEKEMKEKYCSEEENNLPMEIKQLELQNSIKEYEKSIGKFQAAQQKIRHVLQGDITKHPSIQTIHQFQCNESNHEEVFLQRLQRFKDRNEKTREQLIERTNQHVFINQLLVCQTKQ